MRRMMRAAVHLAGVALACALLLSAGCGAEVKSFTAIPRHICAGESVSLDWSVVGSPRMSVKPPSSVVPVGPVARSGHARIFPTTNTRVELDVTRQFGNPTTSVQE